MTMGEIPMTTLPAEDFKRFLGTIQLCLFQLKPAFYSQSYVREIEMLEKRPIPNKHDFNFTDFTD